jgi:hypothetical protein
VCWTAFGLLGWGLYQGAQSLSIDPLSWDRGGPYLAGGVILLAAAYELTPLKHACLRKCRSPMTFLRRQAGSVTPDHTQNIGQTQTDRADARHLRELLQQRRVPELWIPPEHLLELRSKVRLRHTLVDERGEWQQRIQA